MDKQLAAYFIVFQQRGAQEGTLFSIVITYTNFMDFTQVLPKFVKQALKDAQSIRVLSQAEAKSELAPDQGSQFGL